MIDLLKQFGRLQRATGSWFGVLLLLCLILIGSTGFLGYELYQMKKPGLSAEASIHKLVDEVSQAIILPQDELPTVAKVADASQLNGQPFFANARTGDDILIFEKSKKAILWRPSVHRVVEVSSLIAAPVAQSSGTKSEE